MLTHGRGPLVLAEAAVHSYVVAFWVSAAILAASAIVCALVLPSGTLALTGPAEPPPGAVESTSGPAESASGAATKEEMSARDS